MALTELGAGLRAPPALGEILRRVRQTFAGRARTTSIPPRPRFSVCIPTYEMHGYGATFLARSLDALDRQTLRDFEVVVSDHSENTALETLCKGRSQFYPLHYVRCPTGRGNSSVNTNFAVKHAKGDIIKVVHQDDFLYSDDALQRIDQSMRAAPDHHWGGVGCIHVNEAETAFHDPLVPCMNPMILDGMNSFGAPSVLFVKREHYLDFDEALIWVGDCEVYHRLEQAFGPPIIVPDVLVAVRQWSKQVTHTAITEERKASEIRYAVGKHRVISAGIGWPGG